MTIRIYLFLLLSVSMIMIGCPWIFIAHGCDAYDEFEAQHCAQMPSYLEEFLDMASTSDTGGNCESLSYEARARVSSEVLSGFAVDRAKIIHFASVGMRVSGSHDPGEIVCEIVCYL